MLILLILLLLVFAGAGFFSHLLWLGLILVAAVLLVRGVGRY